MKNYSILIVDDEEIIRASLNVDLKRQGYKVATAKNGEVAIEMLKKKNYDLIITDLVMDKLGGIRVLEEAIKLNALAMVMVLTGHATVKTAIEALRLGASDYLLKPYEKDEMFVRIENCMKKIELQRKVKLYEDILPVCCKCKKIRDDTGKMHGDGEWLDMDVYLTNIAKINVSHGFCTECYKEQEIEFEEYLNSRKI